MKIENITNGKETLSGEIVLETEWLRIESRNGAIKFKKDENYLISIQKL